MPRGDKTGPEGRGPMTGRRMGYCVGNNHSGFEELYDDGRGYGGGNRRGFGRGYRRRYIPLSEEIQTNKSADNVVLDEIKSIKQQIADLEKKLTDLKK